MLSHLTDILFILIFSSLFQFFYPQQFHKENRLKNIAQLHPGCISAPLFYPFHSCFKHVRVSTHSQCLSFPIVQQKSYLPSPTVEMQFEDLHKFSLYFITIFLCCLVRIYYNREVTVSEMCLKIPYSIWPTSVKLTKTIAINQWSISGTMNTYPSSSIEKKKKIKGNDWKSLWFYRAMPSIQKRYNLPKGGDINPF